MKWLFFDLGSTLIDERACERQRIADTVAGSAVSPAEFEQAMRSFAARNENAYTRAREHFNLPKAPWDNGLHSLEAPYPGVPELLERLSARYGLGIIANQKPGLEGRMERFGILPYFKEIVGSGDLGISKPDPRIFLAALERANCAPQDAVMVGDRLDNDIAPAQALGFTTVWVRQSYGGLGDPALLPRQPDHIIDSIGQLEWLFR